MTNIEQHKEIINEIHDLYVRKNADYGNSVHDTYERYGLTSFLVRMEDKLNRVRTLNHSKEVKVKDEKIEDTLLDLANYAILAVIELKNEKIKETSSFDTHYPKFSVSTNSTPIKEEGASRYTWMN